MKTEKESRNKLEIKQQKKNKEKNKEILIRKE